MRVAILSMQNVNNFGSLLQSYSLMKLIKCMGHEVFFIDIERRQEDFSLVEGYQMKFDNEKEGMKLWSKIKKIDRYAFNRLRIKKVSQIQNVLFDDFRNHVLNTTKKADHFDYCVIGSDEVFNCLANSSWGFTSQLFGNVKEADHVITYAASCGSTSFEKLPQDVINAIRNSFKRIEGISVRDKNTLQFVNHFTDLTPIEHLDPVLIGDFDNEILAEAEMPFDTEKPYCIVYSYYNRIHTKKEIEEIKDFCKRKGLEVIAAGAPQMWVKQYYALTPFQLLNAFRKASFVITDTFHGTIFAYKYSMRFAVMIRDSNRNKLSDLINKLGITTHLKENKTYEQIYNENRDLDASKLQMISEKKRTLDYLSCFLECRKNDSNE